MKKYECSVCGYIYDEAVGDPDGGIAPGTKWEDIPDDWVCPTCGVGKDEFNEVQKVIHRADKLQVNGTIGSACTYICDYKAASPDDRNTVKAAFIKCRALYI